MSITGCLRARVCLSQRKEGDDVSDVLKETERLCEAIDAVRFCLDCDLAQAEDREDEYDDTDKEIYNATEQVLSAASKYLAEHPADDAEPVTPEWLVSVGLNNELHLGGTFYVQVFADGGVSLNCTNLDTWYGWYEELDLPKCKTRRDVRRLCAALGIELGEESHADC